MSNNANAQDFETPIVTNNDIGGSESSSATSPTNNINTHGGNTSKNKNWLRKATSNVIQHAKQSRAAAVAARREDHAHDTLQSGEIKGQKLYGISSSSPNATTSTTNYNNYTTTVDTPSLSYDNFTFAPPPNFVPISSCDDLGTGIEPPDFETSSNELKISSNFSKLLANSKKVDQVRSSRKAAQTTMITDSKDANEYMKQIANVQNKIYDEDKIESTATSGSNKEVEGGVSSNNIFVQKAQQNLIEQLKQGLDFLTSQNNHLSAHGHSLQLQMKKEGEGFALKLKAKQDELNERNLKLAALEQHFMALNNPTNEIGAVGKVSTVATATVASETDVVDEEDASKAQDNESSNSSNNNRNDDDDDDDDADADDDISNNKEENHNIKENNEPTPTNQYNIAKSAVSSSIVQIDRGYLTDLERTVKLQKKALEKFETEKATLTEKVTTFTEDLEKNERTITHLESSLKLARESRFHRKPAKSKTHRRRVTESVTFSTTSSNEPQSVASMPQAHLEDDDLSMSNASGTATTFSEDKEKESTAISQAVTEALVKEQEEHTSNMDVLSHQLELKDKIIKRHEMKIYDLLNRKEGGATSAMKRVPQDVMLRNISVTNELMDASIRKLEKMMEQLELVESEKRTDLADEISPIRRVATKVSLVHEEMKVTIKLIEQKVKNDIDVIKQSVDDTGNENEDDGKSGQTSGEENETTTAQSSVEERLVEVLSQSMHALKEMEASVKKEIEHLAIKVQKLEFTISEKQDMVEALEQLCSEHVSNYRQIQEEMEQLKQGMK